MVNKKTLALLKANIKPIVCIGETLEEGQLELTGNVLEDNCGFLSAGSHHPT